jgi:hypothetical protein
MLKNYKLLLYSRWNLLCLDLTIKFVLLWDEFICSDVWTFYNPRNEVVGGYTGFTMSVRPSVCIQILCRMITWVVFLRMFWNFISSLPVKRGGSLSFLVGTISNVLVMEIGCTDVGSGGYILVSCAHSNTSCL